MKKLNIAFLVICLLLTAIFGAFVIGYEFQGLGDSLLSKVPLVRNYKWIAMIVIKALLILFSFLAGYSIFGKFGGQNKTIKAKKLKIVVPEKAVESKAEAVSSPKSNLVSNQVRTAARTAPVVKSSLVPHPPVRQATLVSSNPVKPVAAPVASEQKPKVASEQKPKVASEQKPKVAPVRKEAGKRKINF